jgi:hypothetical protein
LFFEDTTRNPVKINLMLKEGQEFELKVDKNWYIGTFVKSIYTVIPKGDQIADAIKIYLNLTKKPE